MSTPAQQLSYDGVMVAVFPPETWSQRYALPGAVPPDILHITLAFIGTLPDLQSTGVPITVPGGFAPLEAATARAAASMGPFEVPVLGSTTLPPGPNSQGRTPMI